MKYAVVKLGGKQYKINEGDTIEVDRINGAKDSKLEIKEVLLLSSDGETTFGKPFLTNVSVKASILEDKKGKKIRVSKFKAKARERRTIGFRPSLTVIKIDKIESAKKEKAAKEKKK